MKHINDVVSHPALITHLTGASNYTWVHFRNGATLLLSKPLSSFEQHLPTFVRVHKTALVNPTYAERVQSPPRTKMPGSVTLQGGAVLPISRRRWREVADALQPHIRLEDSEFTRLTTARKVAAEPTRGRAERETSQPKHLIDVPNRQVYAVIRDDVKSLLLQQILEEKWPHCTVRFFASGASLIDQLERTMPKCLPSLVLLDVRAVGWAGLSTLEHLKTDKRLRLIPTVLFISDQAGNDIEMCYAAGANSVISQVSDYPAFAEAVERICQYWLTFAALPG